MPPLLSPSFFAGICPSSPGPSDRVAAQGKCWPIPRNPPGVGVVGTSPGQILGHAMPPRPFHAISLPSSGPYTSGPYPGLPLSTYEFSEAHRLWVISLRGGGGIKTLPQSPLLLTSEGQRAGGDPQLPRPGPSRGGGWRGPTPDNPLPPPGYLWRSRPSHSSVALSGSFPGNAVGSGSPSSPGRWVPDLSGPDDPPSAPGSAPMGALPTAEWKGGESGRTCLPPRPLSSFSQPHSAFICFPWRVSV